MSNSSTIVCPVDFSEHSKVALQRAATALEAACEHGGGEATIVTLVENVTRLLEPMLHALRSATMHQRLHPERAGAVTRPA